MSGSAPEDGGTAEIASATAHDIYREKPVSTVVRVMTVLAYLLSVSLAAILLSIYYICVWRSPVLAKLVDNRDMQNARLGDPSVYSPEFTHDDPQTFTGGSDTAVNESTTLPTLDNIAQITNANDTAETLVDYIENSTLISTESDYTPQDDETLKVTTVT